MKKVFPIFILVLVLASLVSAQQGQPTVPVTPAEEAATTAEPGTTLYLPIVRLSQPDDPPFDMVDFMLSNDLVLTNGRLYEVQHSGGSQARHQTQGSIDRFYHTKGNEIHAEWEELWATEDVIMRGTDTSPGSGQYYTLYDTPTLAGSAWSPRFWRVGDLYERNPLVIFYQKSNCSVVVSGTQRSWLKFEAYHPQYTFQSSITLANVVELAWLLAPDGSPIEHYFYAQGFGLVGWGSNDHGYSFISQIHDPGQRPNNSRETIPCLEQQPPWLVPALFADPQPLAFPYHAK